VVGSGAEVSGVAPRPPPFDKLRAAQALESRGEPYFDPGGKYHVPANYPYTRYFLAHILQFQFHRALAHTAGCTGPLHRCSIYESREAGQKLNAMLELGMSRPWPDALEALTGSRQMDATAIRDDFAPLQAVARSAECGQTRRVVGGFGSQPSSHKPGAES
jgi:peptidyl-dipeptidase A